MSDANDENNTRAGGGIRAPLTLKPRPGAVSAGMVKQSFSHGRSKTVVVETKRRRIDAPPSGPLGGPSAAEKRAVFDSKPREAAPPRPASSSTPGAPAGGANLNLSAEELRTRQRALEAARLEQERREAERAREAARQAELEAQRRAAEAAEPRAAEPRTHDAPRRDDRGSTTTYRPERPAVNYGQRTEAPRGDRPARPDAGGGYAARPPRDGARPEGARPFGDRPARAGETVRYSALSPRPAAPRDGARPGGPRGPGLGRPEPPH